MCVCVFVFVHACVCLCAHTCTQSMVTAKGVFADKLSDLPLDTKQQGQPLEILENRPGALNCQATLSNIVKSVFLIVKHETVPNSPEFILTQSSNLLGVQKIEAMTCVC